VIRLSGTQLRASLSMLLCVCAAVCGSLSSSAAQEPAKAKHVYTNDDVASAPDASSNGTANSNSTPDPKSVHGPVGRVAPFVATPIDLVQKMLEIAKVTSSDVVYDLGSGDGRIVMYAAEKYGATSVGVELDKDLAKESQAEVERRNLGERVRIIQGDLFETDVSPATVVAVYLLQAANRKLSPILEKDLRPGTRVVAHDIRIPDWKPVEELSVDSGGVQHFIYLYRVPDSFKK
jgi:SAM-dependent methyltransferase